MYVKEKGNVAVLILVVVGILVGFYLYNNLQSETNSVDTSTLEIDTIQKQINEPSYVVEEDNMSTYYNPTHGYMLQFPSDWDIDYSEADEIENYEESKCCNTANLVISNVDTTQTLRTNVLFTGSDAADKCQLEDSCTYNSRTLSVMDMEVERVIVQTSDTSEFVQAYVRDPEKSRGFGTVGIDTDYISPEATKYYINYEGNVLENIDVLDEITESLKMIN